jgi:hypothetical protein
MNRAAIVLVVVAAALTITATASAALPFWWWSASKANRMVVWNNPQGLGPRGHYTTMLKANCLGVRPFRRNARGIRLFHIFRCNVIFRDDDTGRIWTPAYQRSIGMPSQPLHICSSKKNPYGILPYGLGVPGCP